MFMRGGLSLCLGIVLALAPLASAENDGDPVRYDGYQAVRILIDDIDQLEQVRALGLRLMGEAEGFGKVDYLVSPEQLPALEASGLTYIVLQEDVQAALDAEQTRLSNPPRDEAWFADYKTLAQINTYMDQLVTSFPTLVSKQTIGASVQSRPIYALTITSPSGSNKVSLCFDGGIHARERISPTTVLWFAEQLVNDYGSDPDATFMLDNCVFYLIPMFNPDGYQFCWDSDRYWRKNRRNNGSSYGVDLNRNCSLGFGGPGSSGYPGDETYRGPSAFSEPETQAVRDFILAHPDIVAYINFHSYAQLIMRPFGYDYVDPPEPDCSRMDMLSDGMSDAIFGTHGWYYVAQPTYDLYLASGAISDWVYGVAGPDAWAIELRDTGEYGFVLPPSYIVPTGEENYEAIKVLAYYYTQYLSIELPEGLPVRLEPNVPFTLPVKITGVRETLDASSPRMYTRVPPQAFVEIPLTPLGGDLFQATLPATDCGRTREFYFVADTVEGHSVASPQDAPTTVYYAGAIPVVVVLDRNMSTNPNWTRQGLWNWGAPAGLGGQYGNPDPTSGRTGSTVYGYNLNGDYENNLSERHLTTPALDCSGLTGVTLSFWRWLGVEQPAYDHAYVRVSTNGSSYTTIWQNDSEITDDAWVYQEFEISAIADGQPTVYLRWTMGSTDVGWQYCGWNIDDVAVLADDPNGCPVQRGDLDCDGTVNNADIPPFVMALIDPDEYALNYPDCDLSFVGDVDADGSVNNADIPAFVALLTGG